MVAIYPSSFVASVLLHSLPFASLIRQHPHSTLTTTLFFYPNFFHFFSFPFCLFPFFEFQTLAFHVLLLFSTLLHSNSTLHLSLLLCHATRCIFCFICHSVFKHAFRTFSRDCLFFVSVLVSLLLYFILFFEFLFF